MLTASQADDSDPERHRVDVLLVIDMQQGLLHGPVKHDLLAIVERINRLAARVRRNLGQVIFAQHEGPPGDDFAPSSPGWELLGALEAESGDLRVSKHLNDAFHDT